MEALEKGIFEKSEGAVIFPGEKYGLHTRVFMTSAGLPTYEAKDLGLAELQLKEYRPDRILHVVGPEQKGYFEVLFKALAQIEPATVGKEFHLPYGWVRLKEGKMSSRLGNVVLGEWLLDEAKKRIQTAHKVTDAVAEHLAVGAVKYSFLKVGLNQDIAFDIEESISLEGNSGPYLQYAYARARSVLQKAKDSKSVIGGSLSKVGEAELSLLRYLYRFPEIVSVAAENYAPNLLCGFLFEVASRFGRFYDQVPILKAPVAERGLRLALTDAVALTLKNGLTFLGIEAPERL